MLLTVLYTVTAVTCSTQMCSGSYKCPINLNNGDKIVSWHSSVAVLSLCADISEYVDYTRDWPHAQINVSSPVSVYWVCSQRRIKKAVPLVTQPVLCYCLVLVLLRPKATKKDSSKKHTALCCRTHNMHGFPGVSALILLHRNIKKYDIERQLASLF